MENIYALQWEIYIDCKGKYIWTAREYNAEGYTKKEKCDCTSKTCRGELSEGLITES